MRRYFALAFLSLASCWARTQLPVEEEEAELRVPVEQLVCHVREIAAAQKLSFHYGTFEPAKATFRLIGKDFELVAYNPEGPSHSVVGAYDMSSDGSGRAPARRALAEFLTALQRPISPSCAHE